jgi:hypothetical protein
VTLGQRFRSLRAILTGRAIALQSMRSDDASWRAKGIAHERHLQASVITEFAFAVESMMTDPELQARYKALHGVEWTPAPWTESDPDLASYVSLCAPTASQTQAPTFPLRGVNAPLNPDHR